MLNRSSFYLAAIQFTVGISFFKPAAHFIINIAHAVQFKVMHKPTLAWLNDLLPSRRLVALKERLYNHRRVRSK